MLKPLLVLVFSVKVYLVKMCPIFVDSPLAFGARYQSFLRVCLLLHEGVTDFVYPSEKFNIRTDVNTYFSLKYDFKIECLFILWYSIIFD